MCFKTNATSLGVFAPNSLSLNKMVININQNLFLCRLIFFPPSGRQQSFWFCLLTSICVVYAFLVSSTPISSPVIFNMIHVCCLHFCSWLLPTAYLRNSISVHIFVSFVFFNVYRSHPYRRVVHTLLSVQNWSSMSCTAC